MISTGLPDRNKSLLVWHEQLASHFEILARARTQSDWPVFALEHGLSIDQVVSLEQLVRKSLTTRPPDRKLYLPWVVYAAEFGYQYSGDEYWQSFELKTPGWKNSYRQFVRDAFVQFAKKYNGAKPEGPWAENFSIIAWPITHGVLPKDLQMQLARILYEARLSLRPELFSSAATLGKHLFNSVNNTSARFKEFAENTVLLGQIAAALLIQKPEEDLLISSGTLSRLIADINEVRAARSWLRDARSTAERLRIHGLAKREDSGNRHATTSTDSGRAELHEPRVERQPKAEPTFLLRPATGSGWQLFMELDLAPALLRVPSLRTPLSELRGRFSGPRGQVIARGRLIQGGAQLFQLSEWPAEGKPLVHFEGAPPELHLLLQEVMRTPPGASWLFRMAADHQAHYLKGRLTHPGDEYILLTRTETERPFTGFEKIRVDCEGIHGLRFTVPEIVNETWESLLGALQLGLSKILHVWPAGLSPALWNETGDAEWLLNDEVILGVRVDHSIRALAIRLDDYPTERLTLSSVNPETQPFLSLGRLGLGPHQLEIETVRDLAGNDELKGRLNFRILAAKASISGHAAQQAMMLSAYPSSPSLEDIWDNSLELQVLGPTGTSVRCSVTLEEKSSARKLYVKQFPERELPLSSERWRADLQEHFRRDPLAEQNYDLAHRCLIDFNAGTAGRITIAADREFTPLRWVVHHSESKKIVRLIDDTGATGAETGFRSFLLPLEKSPIPYEKALEGVSVAFPGGLFVARVGGKTSAAIVVPTSSHSGFSGLSINPILKPLSANSREIAEVFRIASEWENARLKGSLLTLAYQECVVKKIFAEVFGIIGGPKWARIERENLSGNQQAISDMKKSISDHASERSLGPALASEVESFARSAPDARIPLFANVSRKFLQALALRNTEGPGSSRNESEELCMIALRAASSARSLVAISPGRLEEFVGKLLKVPALARAARYAVFEVSRLHYAATLDAGTTYAGWTW